LPAPYKNRDRVKDLEQLLDLTQDLLLIERYDEVLDALVQRSMTLLGADRGFLVLNQGGDLEFKVVRNWSPQEYEGGKEPISRSILTEVLSRPKPLLIEDAARDPRYERRQSVRELFIRSVLAAPLKVESEIVGALYLETRTMQHFFGPEELELLQRILTLSSRVIASCMRRLLLEQRTAALERDLVARNRPRGILTRDAKLLKVLETVSAAASSELPILIQGASGTGKELVARALHEQSGRAKRPFLTVNCGALSPTLLESELFGHMKGAFTGATQNKLGLIAASDQGTLFLDEVGELPKELQVKLLRTLQFGEVTPVGSTKAQNFDVRFLAATNRDLAVEVKDGRFREDLLYRLNTVTVHLPTLKERPGDILLLFYHFLKSAAEKAGRELPEVTPRLERVLQSYPWPGNVRELENETKRLLTLSPPGQPLTVDRLSPRITQTGGAEGPPLQSLAEMERELVELHLRRAGGNLTHAARGLGITREGLRKMLKRLKLDIDED
jgi:transcriptional regulator with GAF, ATPase, and Fis domain